MSKQSIEDKIKSIQSISSDVDYLRGEFSGVLYSKGGFDGEVDITTMLEFAMEYDYLLEHMLTIAKQIKALNL